MWLVSPINNGFIVSPYINTSGTPATDNQRYVEKVEDVGSAIIALEAKERINSKPKTTAAGPHPKPVAASAYINNNPTVQTFTNTNGAK